MDHEEPWIGGQGGRRITPLRPSAEQVDAADVALALSQTCRFGRRTRPFYSVAEHSVRASLWAGVLGGTAEQRWWALWHDAAEAFLADVPSPIKGRLCFFDSVHGETVDCSDLEDEWLDAIAGRFGRCVGGAHDALVRRVDRALLRAEAEALFDAVAGWTLPEERLPEPGDERLLLSGLGWPVELAQGAFLQLHGELAAELGFVP